MFFKFFKKTKPIFFWVRHIQKTFFLTFAFKHTTERRQRRHWKVAQLPVRRGTLTVLCHNCLSTRRVYFLLKITKQIASCIPPKTRFAYSAQNSLRKFRWGRFAHSAEKKCFAHSAEKKCLTTIARQSKTEADIYIYIYIYIFFSKQKLIK